MCGVVNVNHVQSHLWTLQSDLLPLVGARARRNIAASQMAR